jgi:hypothetical protein
MKVSVIFFLCFLSLSVFSQDYALVKSINGLVTSSGKPLKIGDKVKIGQLVDASKKGSYIDLKIQGKGKMRLVSGVMRVKRIESSESVYELIKGKIFTYLKPDRKKEKRLRIYTAEGSFAVRGTKFAVVKEKNYRSILCVCEGSVEVKNNYGASGVVFENQEVEFSGVDKNISNKISSRDMSELRGMFKKMGL